MKETPKKFYRPLIVTSNDHPLHYLQGVTNNDRNAICARFMIVRVGEEYDQDDDKQNLIHLEMVTRDEEVFRTNSNQFAGIPWHQW